MKTLDSNCLQSAHVTLRSAAILFFVTLSALAPIARGQGIDTPRKVFTLPPGSRSTALAVSNDGRLLASGNSDGSVVVWEAEKGAQMATIVGHESPVLAIGFTSDGTHLVSADRSGRVLYRSTVDWTVKSEVKGEKSMRSGATAVVAISSDGKLVAVCFNKAGGLRERKARINMYSGQVETRSHMETVVDAELISAMAFDSSGSALFVAPFNAVPFKIGIAPAHSPRPVSNQPTTSFALTVSKSGLLAIGAFPGGVSILNVASGTERSRLHDGSKSLVYRIAINNDESVLASLDHRGVLKLWNLRQEHLIRTVANFSTAVYAVTFTPDGKHLFSSTDNSRVLLWDVDRD